MKNKYLKFKLKNYYRKNGLDPFDTIVDLVGDRDGFKSIEVAGKISEDYLDVAEMCNISDRTFFRIIRKHGKKVGNVINKFGHG